MTAQEFFDTLPTKVDPAKIAGLNNTYAFDVKGVGAWTVTVSDGVVSVADGKHDADCTISASEDTLLKIVERQGESRDGVRDGQAQDRRRHGSRAQAAEALLDEVELHAVYLAVRLLVVWGVNVLWR